MSKITYKKIRDFNQSQILNLYNDAGWSNYTNDPDQLLLAFENSLLVYGAFHKDKLVGVIRIVGDGHTIIYIQDLLVLHAYQRQGIASNLIHLIISKYQHVRQICLMSDNDSSLIKFYKSNKFITVNKLNVVSYMYASIDEEN